jgi:hypothetical protein
VNGAVNADPFRRDSEQRSFLLFVLVEERRDPTQRAAQCLRVRAGTAQAQHVHQSVGDRVRIRRLTAGTHRCTGRCITRCSLQRTRCISLRSIALELRSAALGRRNTAIDHGRLVGRTRWTAVCRGCCDQGSSTGAGCRDQGSGQEVAGFLQT